MFWILKFNALLQSEGTLAYDVVKTHDTTDAERLTTEQHIACKIKQRTFPLKRTKTAGFSPLLTAFKVCSNIE